MTKVLVGFLAPCQQNYCFVGKVENVSNGKWKVKLKRPELQCHANNSKSKSQKYVVRNMLSANPAATYSARISVDIPLYEAPRALLDDYLEDKPRIFNAMFADNHGSQQLNQSEHLGAIMGVTDVYGAGCLQHPYKIRAKDEWRLQMLPLKLFALNVYPVVHLRLRCKSRGRDYPLDVPRQISKLLELNITRWELQGLNNVVDPSHFTLAVKGALYPDRCGNKS